MDCPRIVHGLSKKNPYFTAIFCPPVKLCPLRKRTKFEWKNGHFFCPLFCPFFVDTLWTLFVGHNWTKNGQNEKMDKVENGQIVFVHFRFGQNCENEGCPRIVHWTK